MNMTKRGRRGGSYSAVTEGKRPPVTANSAAPVQNGSAQPEKQINGERKPTFKEAAVGHRGNKPRPKGEESNATVNEGPIDPKKTERVTNGVPAVLPTTSKSTQTENQHDVLITFSMQPLIDQIDSMCELVSILGPLELRLLGHCVEAAGKANNALLKQHETRANSSNPCAFFPLLDSQSPQQMSPPLIELLNSIYMNVCLLASSNRLSAHQLAAYIDEIVCKAWKQHLDRLPTTKLKLAAADLMGQIATACVHHPAFNIEQRIRFENLRNDVIRDYRKLYEAHIKAEKEEEKKEEALKTEQTARSSVSSMVFVYIKKFAGHAIPNDSERFSIELTWSDGERTFTQRSRHQLHELQQKLLDKFGGERKDVDSGKKKEDGKKGESSSAARRIIPYFNYDAPANQIIQYINELSELPARMMLSSIIFHEFHEERIAAKHNNQEEKKSSRAQPPAMTNGSTKNRVMSVNANATQSYPLVSNPLSYTTVGMQQMQVLQIMEPTCSACAGSHPFQFCDKASNLDRPGDYRLDYSDGYPEGSSAAVPQTTPQQPPPTSQPPHVNGHQMNGVHQMVTMQQQQQQPQQMTVHPVSGQYTTYLAAASSTAVPTSAPQTYRRVSHMPVHHINMAMAPPPMDTTNAPPQPPPSAAYSYSLTRQW